MALAGMAWGVYTLLGQGGSDPVFGTARNFALTLPLVLLGLLLLPFTLTPRGMALAALSGAVTSGLGYVLWYRVLRRLSTSTAAILQLSVPALAALGGVLLLGESIPARLAIAGNVIGVGILLKLTAPKRS